MAGSLLGTSVFGLGFLAAVVTHGCGPMSVRDRGSSAGSSGFGEAGANDGGANDGGANDGGANDGGANDGTSAGNTTGGSSPASGGASNAGGAGLSSGGSTTGGAHTTGGGSNGGGANTGGADTAGSGGSAPLGSFACAGTKPGGSLITSFADLSPSTPGNFTFGAGLSGGTFAYQAGQLTLTATPELALNIKGTVSTFDGFGFYFGNCTDASAYTGVSFIIKGAVGPSGMLNFQIKTNANTVPNSANMRGGCIVPAGTTDTYAVCHEATSSIPVTATGGVVSVKFSSLTGGAPNLTVSGKDIIGLEWAFAWSNDIPYPADVTIDDLQFTTN